VLECSQGVSCQDCNTVFRSASKCRSSSWRARGSGGVGGPGCSGGVGGGGCSSSSGVWGGVGRAGGGGAGGVGGAGGGGGGGRRSITPDVKRLSSGVWGGGLFGLFGPGFEGGGFPVACTKNAESSSVEVPMFISAVPSLALSDVIVTPLYTFHVLVVFSAPP